MSTVILALATGFYTGYLPKAPGTWGSLVALPLNLLLIQLAPSSYAGVLLALLALSILVAGSAEKIFDTKDPGFIVIDEIMGMLVALIGAPHNSLVWLLAFFLFRLFDIWKPFPIRWIDHQVQGGVGIVLDDVLAGLVTLAVLQGLGLFLNW
ncbi:MAG: phosphatidylglycerophosphatase A [Deltaproteobacteria bacterium]|jgi:phosphatidylglycerophosphatase A